MLRVIEIDARGWRTYDDVFNGLLPALGAPEWHGRNLAALIDSIGTGSINAVEPRYRLVFRGSGDWPPELCEFVRDLCESVARNSRYMAENYGQTREIEFLLVP